MIRKYACSNPNCKKNILLSLNEDKEASLIKRLGKETIYCPKCAKTLFNLTLFSSNKKYVTLSEIKRRRNASNLENKNIIENYLE